MARVLKCFWIYGHLSVGKFKHIVHVVFKVPLRSYEIVQVNLLGNPHRKHQNLLCWLNYRTAWFCTVLWRSPAKDGFLSCINWKSVWPHWSMLFGLWLSLTHVFKLRLDLEGMRFLKIPVIFVESKSFCVLLFQFLHQRSICTIHSSSVQVTRSFLGMSFKFLRFRNYV